MTWNVNTNEVYRVHLLVKVLSLTFLQMLEKCNRLAQVRGPWTDLGVERSLPTA